MTLRRLTACAVAFGLLVSGCGEGEESDEAVPLSKENYQAAIVELVHESREANRFYSDLVTSRPQDECVESMERFHEEVRTLTGSASELQPPQAVAADHSAFVAAAERSVDRVAEIEDTVRSGDTSCGRELNDVLYGMPSSDQALAAIERIEKEGYVVLGR